MKSFSKYFIELVVIVVGITLSFMVDEWREENQNRKETIEALKLIHKNLVQDSLNLAYILDLHIKPDHPIRLFLNEPDLASDTLEFEMLTAGLSTPNLAKIQSGGYNALLMKNELIIKNDSLFNLLTSYYLDNGYMDAVEDYNNASDELFNLVMIRHEKFYKIYNFYRSRLEFEDFNAIPGFIENVNRVTRSSEFRNKFFQKFIYFQIGVSQNAESKLKECRTLLKIVDEELHN